MIDDKSFGESGAAYGGNLGGEPGVPFGAGSFGGSGSNIVRPDAHFTDDEREGNLRPQLLSDFLGQTKVISRWKTMSLTGL